MADDGIFPTTLSGKSEYYNRCIPYCDTHKVRLLIDATKIGDQVTNLTSWNGVYPDSVDPNLTTKTLRDQRDGLIPVIEDGMREIYDDIPESKLIDADRNTLNLKKPDTVKTPRPPITDTPTVRLRGMEGARMEFTCRTSVDSSRASIHPDADGVEVVYIIGTTAPATPNDCTKTYFSSKAHFTIELDIADAGKRMFCFIRWKNNTDVAKSGPWIAVNAMITA